MGSSVRGGGEGITPIVPIQLREVIVAPRGTNWEVREVIVAMKWKLTVGWGGGG